ncbi:MAG: DUF3791 domain-containing protein [Lachnospiraceae bacterium]|nr:DUF3791 domain-containing protein [Lachnospiraceae bacterium]
MSKDVFSFVIYMIHACADRWNQTPSAVYRILQQSDCISGFLVPHYEILHTQGTTFIVNDITEYLHVRGVQV